MQKQSPVTVLSATTLPESAEAAEDVESITGWRMVTPEQATTWLAKRKHNRAIRKTDVTFLSRQLREGLWRRNPQPILFERSSGLLVDGQHRLSAVVDSGIPTWFRIESVDDDVMPVLDTGRSRTAGDVLSMGDQAAVSGSYTAQAAAAKLLLAWERNRNPFIGQAGGSGRIANVEIWQFMSRALYPTIVFNVARGVQLQSAGVPGGSGMWGAMLTKFETIDSALCDEFYEGMLTGADLAETSPILAVRNRLRASRNSRYVMPRVETATVIIRGWNAFVEKRPLMIVRGRVRGDSTGRVSDAAFPLPSIPSRDQAA